MDENEPPQESGETFNISSLAPKSKADFLVYLSCILAIGVSFYAIDHGNDLLDACNAHWQEEFTRVCVVQDRFIRPDADFSFYDLNYSAPVT